MKSRVVRFVFFLSIFGVGCANDTEFRKNVGPSSSAISIAEDAGAAKVPSAAIYLQLAKQELDHAKDLVTAHEYEEANSQLIRAEADAELAAALAMEDSERKDASEAMSRVHQLKKDNSRSNPEGGKGL